MRTFTPPHAEALWKLVTVPHPIIGKAHHLGEALVHAGLITPPVLADALQIQRFERENGNDPQLGQILVSHGHVTPEQLQRVIDSWLGEYVVDPGKLTPDPAAWRWCRARWPSANRCCRCSRATMRWSC